MDMDAVRLTRLRRLIESGATQAIRESAGLSLSEASAGSDVNRITIHRWEKGQRKPHGEAALRYLELLEQLTGVGLLFAVLLGTLAVAFDPDRWYTPTEIWRESHGARAQVYEALERGELRGLRRGRRWLVPGRAVRDWIGGDRDEPTE